MRIPRHWERAEGTVEVDGDMLRVRAWGWSDESVEAARRMADERLPAVRRAVEEGKTSRSYEYLANPIRELRIAEHSFPGEGRAVVTRNGYGALVLNCSRAMFVDIDTPGSGCLLPFGKSVATRKRETVERVRAHVAAHGGGFRIYETCAGLRLLATDRLREPAAQETLDGMRALGSDDLYLRLCKAQTCFRARLTPKPWRIGVARPPVRFPLPADRPGYDTWVRTYEEASAPFRTCRFLEAIGTDAGDPEIRFVTELHDRTSGTDREGDLR